MIRTHFDSERYSNADTGRFGNCCRRTERHADSAAGGAWKHPFVLHGRTIDCTGDRAASGGAGSMDAQPCEVCGSSLTVSRASKGDADGDVAGEVAR